MVEVHLPDAEEVNILVGVEAHRGAAGGRLRAIEAVEGQDPAGAGACRLTWSSREGLICRQDKTCTVSQDHQKPRDHSK